jgi:hypothetical protein
MDARTKKVSLEFMGEGWKDCYVELRYYKWADYKRFIEIEQEQKDDFVEAIVQKVKHVFVSGQVLDNGKSAPLAVDAIGDFDVETLKVLNNAALGYLDPKESSASAPITESTPQP